MLVVDQHRPQGQLRPERPERRGGRIPTARVPPSLPRRPPRLRLAAIGRRAQAWSRRF
jgi:hypothetical protein